MKDRIIIALDVATFAEAQKLIDALPEAGWFKVGLQAFLAYGTAIASYLAKKEKRLFLDLKFCDIPNTVQGAVAAVLQYQPAFLTIHLGGGRAMAEKALAAAAANPHLKLLGVTVLTSLSDADLAEAGHALPARELVLKLFRMGLQAGLDGFVCSPEETALLRQEGGEEPVLVTPGVRPEWSEKNDQKRFFTPAQAIAAGSSFLVIGRPITRHIRPGDAFAKIAAEMEAGARTSGSPTARKI